MLVDHLVAHGFSPRTVARWKRTREESLLPLQEHAVARTGLLSGRSVALFAPTSSGKTFVGEIAAMRHIERGGRAMFLVPTRALAEELHAQLSATYAALGLRLAVSTAELRLHDGAIVRGEFDMAVLVYEKLRALLAAQPELCGLVTCVVADELQILGDRQRGAAADLVLTKCRRAPRPPQIVAMSAVVDEHDRLTQWLGAEAVVWRQRPIELREGVLDLETGLFHYRQWNTGQEDAEPLLGQAVTDGGGAGEPTAERTLALGVAALARELAQEREEQVLIFVPTKRQSLELARRLADELTLPAAPQALVSDLAQADGSDLAERAAQLAQSGVGFHNADVPARLRRRIERAFDHGHLRVLVATSTLAHGVNLGCRNVVSFPTMVAQGAVADRLVLLPLSRAQLRNQGGRAGRYRRTASFGRSMVVVARTSEVEHAMDEYFRRPTEPIHVTADAEQRLAWCLDRLVTLASRPEPLTRSRAEEDLTEFLGSTYWGQGQDRRFVGAAVRSAMAALESEAIVASVGQALAVSGLAEVLVAFGVDTATVAHWRRALEGWAEIGRPPSDLAWLLAAATSPEGGRFPLAARRSDIDSARFLRRLHARIAQGELPGDALPFCLAGGGARAQDHAALRQAFLAEAWVSRRPTRDIEREFSVFAGTAEALASHLAWLLDTAAAIAARLELPEWLSQAATELAECLRAGVPRSGLALARRLPSLVARSHLLRLLDAGIDSPEALETADPAWLARLLPAEACAWLAGSREDSRGAPQPALRQRSSANHAPTPGRRIPTQTGAEPTSSRVREEPVRGAEPELAPSSRHSKSSPHAAAPAPQCQPAQSLDSPPEEAPNSDPARVRLELDPRSPGVVRLAGVALWLSVMPYRLLAYLAANPRRVVPYAEIDAALWPDAKVEQQQILAHKAAIVRRLSEAVGRDRAQRLVRTIPGHGLFLDLPREAIVHELCSVEIG